MYVYVVICNLNATSLFLTWWNTRLFLWARYSRNFSNTTPPDLLKRKALFFLLFFVKLNTLHLYTAHTRIIVAKRAEKYIKISLRVKNTEKNLDYLTYQQNVFHYTRIRHYLPPPSPSSTLFLYHIIIMQVCFFTKVRLQNTTNIMHYVYFKEFIGWKSYFTAVHKKLLFIASYYNIYHTHTLCFPSYTNHPHTPYHLFPFIYFFLFFWN